MLNLSLKELRLIATNRNISCYKSMPRYKLLRIINNKGDRKSLLKYKRRRKNQKKSLQASKKESF